MPQSEAQVGAAGVYYADGNGVVRLLTQSGESRIVATFPMTPDQHELWYAVSPDGSWLLAGILDPARDCSAVTRQRLAAYDGRQLEVRPGERECRRADQCLAAPRVG
jgi:hypothetical protein